MKINFLPIIAILLAMNIAVASTAQTATTQLCVQEENPLGNSGLLNDLQEIIIDYLDSWQSHRITGHTGHVFSAQFSADGSYFATGSQDKTVKVWDTKSQKMRATMPMKFSQHEVDPRLLPSLPLMLTLGFLTNLGTVTGLVIDPQNKWIATMCVSYTGLNFYDIETKKQCGRIDYPEQFSSLALSPDGKKIATGGQAHKIILWDTLTKKKITSYAGHTDSVLKIAFDMSGNFIISASFDKQIRIWDLQKKQVVKLLGHNEQITAVQFSLDGSQALSADLLKNIFVWDISKRKIMTTLTTVDFPRTISISPDGKYLAAGHDSNTVDLFNLKTEKQLMPMSIAAGATSVVFSPDGYLVIAAKDTLVLLLYNQSIKLRQLLEKEWQHAEKKQTEHITAIASTE